MSALDKSRVELYEENKLLKSKNDELKFRIIELENELNTYKKDLKKVKNENIKLKKDIDEIYKKTTTQGGKNDFFIDMFKMYNDAMKAKINELQEVIKDLENKIYERIEK